MLPGLVVVVAVTFNFLLAIFNAQGMPITTGAVVASEVVLMLTIHCYAIINYRAEMLPWHLLIGLSLVLFFLRSLATGSIEPKYVRDVVIIPTYIILGLTSNRKVMDRSVLALLAIVTLVGVVEAFFPDIYANLVNVKSFYIATRGNTDADFYNGDSTLFFSSMRPQERLFNFIDMPRMSSIFLEPVSLGNYCVIMTAYLCVRFRQLSTWILLIGSIGLAFLLVGCDGRLAAGSMVLVVGVVVMAPYFPRFSAPLYLPLALIWAAVIVLTLNPDGQADDLPGRIAHTIDTLSRYELADWLGISDGYLWLAMDSGIAYLIMTQSIIGTAVIWLFIACIREQKNLSQVRFTHGILLYFVLTMMVSYSMLTIKTAALAWFMDGVLQRRRPSCYANYSSEGNHPYGSFGKKIPEQPLSDTVLLIPR
jgi:putative polymerase